MRQAGRYLPEYNATRARAGSFLGLAKSPAFATEVTLQPLERYALDAAILFSDILTVPDAMGLGLYFAEGEGPKFRHPVRTRGRCRAARAARPAWRAALRRRRGARDSRRARQSRAADRLLGQPVHARLLHGRRRRFRRLPHDQDHAVRAPRPAASRCWRSTRRAVTDYLNAQVEAGAQALMLFDTWGGALSTAAYREFSLAYMQQVVAGLRREHDGERVPSSCSPRVAAPGSSRSPTSVATRSGSTGARTCELRARRVGARCALQGNLDPMALFAPPEALRREVDAVLDAFGPLCDADGRWAGHVFNLGHGISQFTPPESRCGARGPRARRPAGATGRMRPPDGFTQQLGRTAP